MADQIHLRARSTKFEGHILLTQYDLVRSSDGREVGHISIVELRSKSLTDLEETIAVLEEIEKYSCSGLLRGTPCIPVQEIFGAEGLVFIDEVFVNKKFRSHGFGSQAVSLLIDRYSAQGLNFALEACPGIDGSLYEQISNVDQRITQSANDTDCLKKWYYSLGFSDIEYQDYMFIQGR